MKPAYLKFQFNQETMEILINALEDYEVKARTWEAKESAENVADLLHAFKAQLGWALAK